MRQPLRLIWINQETKWLVKLEFIANTDSDFRQTTVDPQPTDGLNRSSHEFGPMEGPSRPNRRSNKQPLVPRRCLAWCACSLGRMRAGQKLRGRRRRIPGRISLILLELSRSCIVRTTRLPGLLSFSFPRKPQSRSMTNLAMGRHGRFLGLRRSVETSERIEAGTCRLCALFALTGCCDGGQVALL